MPFGNLDAASYAGIAHRIETSPILTDIFTKKAENILSRDADNNASTNTQEGSPDQQVEQEGCK